MKKIIFVLCLLSKGMTIYGQETLQSVTDRGAASSNIIQLSASRPIELTSRGSGIYNKTVITSNIENWGFHVDLARNSDALNAPASDFGIAVRGARPLFYLRGQDGNVGIGNYPAVTRYERLKVSGGIYSYGGSSTLSFTDRADSSIVLSLYGDKGNIKFWSITAGDLLSINHTNGNVGIGTLSPEAKLTVAGNIHSREVKVSVSAGADFVFREDYTLKPLEEIEAFVTKNEHLPGIASADKMKKEGIDIGDMNIKLLQKVEELTLYLIEQNKKVQEQEKQIGKLTAEISEIRNGSALLSPKR
ncbi:hypothetical protein [Pararcticibacter amylolyticus]|uniref:Peptidase S74 domain-containing protein n=1 Tax=Pararcticibacter amylolyticus TaxID=2173175 RepID=A0A2U2PC27_9SPHI|nr:hypothetical protein [Pararcticibacter amylolyticus]PWG78958.1 hypothetical protein DDR33_20115 [Pararcticibacter amylolyticus]